MESSKIPSFASRFRFGPAKNKNENKCDKQQQKRPVMANQQLNQEQSESRNSNDRSSVSPASTLTSNHSSEAENKHSKKHQGLFSRNKHKNDQNHQQTKDGDGGPVVKETTTGFKFKFFGNFVKNHYQTSATAKSSNGSKVKVTVKSPENVPKRPADHAEERLVVTTTADMVTNRCVQRPTYLPAMISADQQSEQNGSLSNAAIVYPPSSNKSALKKSSETNGEKKQVVVVNATVTSVTESHSRRSTSLLPATNPYIKPRSPNSPDQVSTNGDKTDFSNDEPPTSFVFRFVFSYQNKIFVCHLNGLAKGTRAS